MGVKLNTEVVQVDMLIPNDWNPNKQSDMVYEAEIESIKEYGFIDPITVRKHPALEGQYQIIDGEHRYKAALDLGLDEVSVNVINVDEKNAKKLTLILNETRGEADKIELAKLLASLEGEFEDLIKGLPYSEEELDELISFSDADWDNYDDDFENEEEPTTSKTVCPECGHEF